MKSTDMFFSAEDRKKSETPIQLIHSSSIQPKGLAPSPFVVSLWEGKKIPTNRRKKIIDNSIQTENKENYRENYKERNEHINFLETDDEELQTIENLFRGKGRIEYNTPLKSKQKEDNNRKSFLTQEKSIPDENAKKIYIPSRKEQLEKMKQCKEDYSVLFKKPSQKNNSFFRNFAFWK